MSTSGFYRPEPMDLKFSEGDGEDEAELQITEQHRVIRRCYTCESTKHLRPGFPVRKQRQAHMSRIPANSYKSGRAREASTLSRCGVPYWG